MYKKLAILFLAVFVFVGTSFAFTVENPLSEQVDQLDGVTITDNQLTLDKNSVQINDLFINPNYPSSYDMYLSTDAGIYLNRQFNADWNIHDSLTEVFPNGLTGLQFDGNYLSSKTMLAYSPDSIFISYNDGDSWLDITPATDEEILFANFGPYFQQNELIYFITASGLYRIGFTSDSIDLVMESLDSQPVSEFTYLRSQTSDSIFYVARGNKIYKTQDFGDNFFEYAFASDIRNIKIVKTASSSYLLVLTDDNKVYYANNEFNFIESVLPGDISEISSVGELLSTDNAFYITYTYGESFTKLDYDASTTDDIKDYDYIKDGSSRSLFAINGNTIYSDSNFDESFIEYMNGIDVNEEYMAEGTAVSKNVLDLFTEQFADNYMVKEASIAVDGDLNDQTVIFFMTVDGTNWEEIALDEVHTFETPGADLRWKAVLSTTDTAVSPLIRSVLVDFGMDETTPPVDETICAGFPDVPANDPSCPAITYVKEQGIFAGYPDGNFKPDEPINRAETVKVITEGFDITMLVDDGTNLGFSDVIIGEWYMGYLKTAKEAGIIEGYPDKTFKPEQIVNYVEMLKIFLETANVEFVADPTGEDWYQKYLDYVEEVGLIKYEKLDSGMKRSDVAKLFYQWSLQ